MAHQILGDKFAQQDQRRAPWHEIQGAVFQPATLPSEGLVALGGDFLVESRPLQTTVVTEFGEVVIPVEGQYALVRPPLPEDPEPKVLGIHGENYEVIQPLDFTRAFDPLVNSGWVLETLGVLHSGAQLFLTFAAGGFVVNEDDIELYWVASEHKAKSAINIFSAHTRVVCANTYRIAEGQAMTSLAIPHYRGAAQELDFAVQVLKATQTQQEKFKETLERFGRTRLTTDTISELLPRIYPEPSIPRKARFIDELSQNGGFLAIPKESQAEYARLQERWLMERDRIERTREAVADRVMVFNQDRPDYANTAWAVWNGVTEVENFKTGKERGISTLFGGRAEVMERAYRTLLTVN